jgi:hypothetical protein
MAAIADRGWRCGSHCISERFLSNSTSMQIRDYKTHYASEFAGLELEAPIVPFGELVFYVLNSPIVVIVRVRRN